MFTNNELYIVLQTKERRTRQKITKILLDLKRYGSGPETTSKKADPDP